MKQPVGQNWICCQIGAREHYAIPRALQQQQILSCLITDAWVGDRSYLKFFNQKNLNDRFHRDLSQAKIYAFNNSIIRFEIAQKILAQNNWQKIIARNNWFQHHAIQKLLQIAPQFDQKPILFAYSYAALELFKFAKNRGWLTVLGQIDPGILEEKIVVDESQRYSQYVNDWQTAPSQYWQNWQQECQLADIILVNSNWSANLLNQAGVKQSKLKTLPLVYTNQHKQVTFTRVYPESFNRDRPLKVLFLGQVILRKGISHLLEAINLLQAYPIEFWIVGAVQINLSPYWQTHTQVKWLGQVNRSNTEQYYQLADVFLFPTLSDGFGLTQLEAQSWHLPIITSRNCGEVVVDGVNGWIMDEVSGMAIADILKQCFTQPEYLAQLAKQTHLPQEFSLKNLAINLANLF